MYNQYMTNLYKCLIYEFENVSVLTER